MRFHHGIIRALTLLLIMANTALANDPVLHAIDIQLDPQRGALQATDRLQFPAPLTRVEFVLHAGLNPELIGDGQLRSLGQQGHLRHYRVEREHPSDQLRLRYQGQIQHPLQNRHEGLGRSRQQTLGTISDTGVFLTGFTGWYPRLADTLDSLKLRVDLPPGWLAVSQGEGPGALTPGAPIHWHEAQPQDALYLIAAPWQLYRQEAGGIEAQAYLRTPDAELAQRYLEATTKYLHRYATLIGPYPYAKFALVENFWETGYGMPSFTLLGPRVLRLPFILDSAYPHEILHNWWGNGVFVADSGGNWSEGLTAYLADHLNQALAGRGSAYRHDQLSAYADYVQAGEDQPLSAFRARHDQASQAIGYGKSLMVFHMLRLRLGDDQFLAGLRRFYAGQRFRVAGWEALQQAFEQASGTELSAFLRAWVERPGALRLELAAVETQRQPDGGYQIRGTLRQSQPQAPYPVSLPVVLHDLHGQPQEIRVEFAGERARDFVISSRQAPLRLAVDPQFDSFRQLEAGEQPVTLSHLFGAPAGHLILPSQAAPERRRAYRQLAERWQAGQPGWRLVSDQQLKALPAGPVWLLGWENLWLPTFAAGSADFRLDVKTRAVTIQGTQAEEPIPVLTRRLQGRALGWLAVTEVAALPGLARKLPHYGKYSYLLFSGSAPDNRLKGQWPVHDSPLLYWFDASPARRPALQPLQRPSLLDAGSRLHLQNGDIAE